MVVKGVAKFGTNLILQRRGVGGGDGVPVVLGGADAAEFLETGVFVGVVEDSGDRVGEHRVVEAGDGRVGAGIDLTVGREVIGDNGKPRLQKIGRICASRYDWNAIAASDSAAV